MPQKKKTSDAPTDKPRRDGGPKVKHNGKQEGGRPRVDIDWDSVDRMLYHQTTAAEIAGMLGIHANTLTEACKREHDMTFRDYMAQRSAPGKVSLRRKQFRVAMSGNVPMLKHLGNQYLGQSDKTQLSGPGGGPIETNTKIDVKSLSTATLKELNEAFKAKQKADQEAADQEDQEDGTT